MFVVHYNFSCTSKLKSENGNFLVKKSGEREREREGELKE